MSASKARRKTPIQTPIASTAGLKTSNTLTVFLANVLALRGAWVLNGHDVVSLGSASAAKLGPQSSLRQGRRRVKFSAPQRRLQVHYENLTAYLYFLYELFMPVGGRKDKLKEVIVSIEEVYSPNGNGVPAIRAVGMLMLEKPYFCCLFCDLYVSGEGC